jgi:HEAT repeat protein
MAVRSLGHLGAGEAILPIIQSKQSETNNPSMRLMETLREFGPQIQAEPLIALANDPATPDHVLRYAISALGVTQDRRAVEIFKYFVKQPKFLVNTVLALGDSSLPEAVPLLVQVLESKRIKPPVYGLKNRDALDHTIIDMLGKLQYPSAFKAIEKFAKQKLPAVWAITIHALAATGGEKAIPFLRQAWELDAENQQHIIQALLWIGTSAAADVIKELLATYTPEKAILLAKVLHRGRSLYYLEQKHDLV